MKKQYTLEELNVILEELKKYKNEAKMRVRAIEGGIGINNQDRYKLQHRAFIPGDNADLENIEDDLKRQQKLKAEAIRELKKVSAQVTSIENEIAELEGKLEKV